MFEAVFALLLLFRTAIVGVVAEFFLANTRRYYAEPQTTVWAAVGIALLQLALFPPMQMQADWTSSTSGAWPGVFKSRSLDQSSISNANAGSEVGGYTVRDSDGQTYVGENIGVRVDLLQAFLQSLFLAPALWFLYHLRLRKIQNQQEEQEWLESFEQEHRRHRRRSRRSRSHSER